MIRPRHGGLTSGGSEDRSALGAGDKPCDHDDARKTDDCFGGDAPARLLHAMFHDYPYRPCPHPENAAVGVPFRPGASLAGTAVFRNREDGEKVSNMPLCHGDENGGSFQINGLMRAYALPFVNACVGFVIERCASGARKHRIDAA